VPALGWKISILRSQLNEFSQQQQQRANNGPGHTHSRRIQKSHYSDGALLLSSVRNNGKTARAFAATQISIFLGKK